MLLLTEIHAARGKGRTCKSICGEHAWIWTGNEDPIRQNNIEKTADNVLLPHDAFIQLTTPFYRLGTKILGSIHVQRIPCYCICDKSETRIEYLNYNSQVKNIQQTEKMSQACSSNRTYQLLKHINQLVQSGISCTAMAAISLM